MERPLASFALCKPCNSPLAEEIDKRLRRRDRLTEIARWTREEGEYVSREALRNHRDKHLTTEVEKARIDAIEDHKRKRGTIKASRTDLAMLVRDKVLEQVEQGVLTPTVQEGLRAQELLDKRAEKASDRELSRQLALVLSGAWVPVIEGDYREVELLEAGE